MKNSSGRVRVAKKKFGSGRVAGTRQSLTITHLDLAAPSFELLRAASSSLSKSTSSSIDWTPIFNLEKMFDMCVKLNFYLNLRKAQVTQILSGLSKTFS